MASFKRERPFNKENPLKVTAVFGERQGLGSAIGPHDVGRYVRFISTVQVVFSSADEAHGFLISVENVTAGGFPVCCVHWQNSARFCDVMASLPEVIVSNVYPSGMAEVPPRGTMRKPTPCTKCSHSNELQARASASQVCKLHGDHMIWVYQCPVCNRWHLTGNKIKGVPPATADETYFHIPVPYTTL